MFSFSSPTEWAHLAATLGFTPHEPVAGFGRTASFRQLKRALGPVAGPPPKFRHWLRGRHNGQRALVVIHIEGSGSNQTTWTSVVVEIDPPLFLGASITEDSPFVRFFNGQDLQLGVPDIDNTLRLGALDPARMRALLLASVGDASFLGRMPELVKAGYAVTDSTVVWSKQGHVRDPGVIGFALQTAGWIAHQLAQRRAALAPMPAEQAVQRLWQSFADERGLTFDPARMHMHGIAENAGVEIALETNAGLIKTGRGVRFPHHAGVRLHVARAGVFAFLSRLFTNTIKTGDAAFDDAVIVEGSPEPAVRQLFSSPKLRHTLMSIAAAAQEFTMTETGIFWLWPIATVDAGTLAGHLHAAITATQEIFGEVKRQGPYR